MPGIVKHNVIKKRLPRDISWSTHSDRYIHVDTRTGDKISWNDLNSKLSGLRKIAFSDISKERKYYFELQNNPEILNKYKSLLIKLKKAISEKDLQKTRILKLEISKLPWRNKNKFVDWDIAAIQDWQFFKDHVKKVIGKIIRGNAQGRVLDIGSGSWNYFEPEFNEIPFPRKITAIDASKEMLLRSQASKRIQLDLGEISKGKKLPFKDQEFDTLNLSFIINYIDYFALGKVFNEFNRVTKKGGTILIIGSKNSGLKEQQKHPFNSREYIGILEGLGYKVKEHSVMLDNEIENIEKGKYIIKEEFCKLIVAYKPK